MERRGIAEESSDSREGLSETAVNDIDECESEKDMSWKPDDEDYSEMGSSENEDFGDGESSEAPGNRGDAWFYDRSDGSDSEPDTNANASRPQTRPRKTCAILGHDDYECQARCRSVDADGGRIASLAFGADAEFHLVVRGDGIVGKILSRDVCRALVDVLRGILDEDPVPGLVPTAFHDAVIEFRDLLEFLRTASACGFVGGLGEYEREPLDEAIPRLEGHKITSCRVWSLGVLLGHKRFMRYALEKGLTPEEMPFAFRFRRAFEEDRPSRVLGAHLPESAFSRLFPVALKRHKTEAEQRAFVSRICDASGLTQQERDRFYVIVHRLVPTFFR